MPAPSIIPHRRKRYNTTSQDNCVEYSIYGMIVLEVQDHIPNVLDLQMACLPQTVSLKWSVFILP